MKNLFTSFFILLLLMSCDKEENMPNNQDAVHFVVRIPEGFSSTVSSAYVVSHSLDGKLIDYAKVNNFSSVIVEVEKGENFNLSLIKVPLDDPIVYVKTITNISRMGEFYFELFEKNQHVEKSSNGIFEVSLHHYMPLNDLIISDGFGNSFGMSMSNGYNLLSEVISYTEESDATYLLSAQASNGEWRYSYFIKQLAPQRFYFDDLKPMQYQISIPSTGLKNLDYGIIAASAHEGKWHTYFEINSNYRSGRSDLPDDGNYRIGFIEEFEDYKVGMQATEEDDKNVYYYKLGKRPTAISLPLGRKVEIPKFKLDDFEVETDFDFNNWEAMWALRGSSNQTLLVWDVLGDKNKFSLKTFPTEILSEIPALQSYQELNLRQIRLHKDNRSYQQKIEAIHIKSLGMEEIERYTISKNFQF